MKDPKAFESKTTKTYWSGKGKHEAKADLLQKLIPSSGEAAPPALNRFRSAVNCYYDLYNNGLCNRAAEFRAAFGFSGMTATAERIEARMDELVLAAWAEQKPTSLAKADDALESWKLHSDYKSKYDTKKKPAPKAKVEAFRDGILKGLSIALSKDESKADMLAALEAEEEARDAEKCCPDERDRVFSLREKADKLRRAAIARAKEAR